MRFINLKTTLGEILEKKYVPHNTSSQSCFTVQEYRLGPEDTNTSDWVNPINRHFLLICPLFPSYRFINIDRIRGKSVFIKVHFISYYPLLFEVSLKAYS